MSDHALAERLIVALDGVEVAEVTRSRAGDLTLRYLPDASPTAPLSPHLPVSSRSFDHAAVEPLLSGLLPDNEAVRRRWARQFATDNTPSTCCHIWGSTVPARSSL